jgi:HD-GYP domain-containing protein (c-di-GMP phosphodiesterase class II)
MRLSDILKSEMTTSAPIAPKKPAAPVPPSKSSTLKPAPTAPDMNAAIERAVAETRKRLEQDFQRQLDTIREESRRLTEEKVHEEEQRSFLRNEALKKEKLQLAAQIEQMRLENEALKFSGKNLDVVQKEIAEARAKLAEEFQKKIAELEMQRQHKEEPKSVPQPMPQPPMIPVVIPADAYVSVKKVERELSAKAAFDPVVTAKARQLYLKLMTSTQTFFDRARRQEIKVESLMTELDAFIQNEGLHDDLIALISEPYTQEQAFVSHGVNCCIFAIILGNDLKLSYDELRVIGIAALLHDIGLLNCYENLDYPRQLPAQIKEEILKHPEKGAEILTPHLSEAAITSILQHQELMNGKGYPKGLKGDDIHFFSRILSIVDAFEAMIHERPYRRKALEISQAVKEMIETERGLYDRDIMKALLARVGLYPVKSLVELSNRQIARVMRQNRQFPLSPIIQVEFDENGLKLAHPQILDLSKNQLIHVTGPVKPQVTQIRDRAEKPASKAKKTNVFMEVIPLLLMAGILLLLVYLIVKI